MLRDLIVSLFVSLSLGACGSDTTGPEALVARLEVVTGDQQTDTVGQPLPDPVVVRALDSAGDPVAGVAVDFVIVLGGGEVARGRSRSDQYGLTTDLWTLGETAGEQRLEARVGGAVAATFTATALPDRIYRIVAWPDSQIAAAGDTIVMGHRVQFHAAAFDRYDNLNSDSGFSWTVEPTIRAQIDAQGLLAPTDTGVVTVRASKGLAAGTYDVDLVPNPDNPRALDFVLDAYGSSDYVEVPFHVSLDLPTEWTIEFWMKPRRIVAERPQFLVSRWGGPYGSYAVWLDDSRFEVAIVNGSKETRLRSSRPAVIGVWQHFAVTSDGQALRLYIDGELDNELEASVGAIQALSAMNFGRTPLNTYDGLMDEVRIWHTSRTSSQLLTAMTRGLSGTEPGLVAYWRFDEGHGDTAFDGTSSLNDGRLGESVGPDDLDPRWSFDVPLVDRWRGGSSR